jgi:Protein of unknown function (DUF1524)
LFAPAVADRGTLTVEHILPKTTANDWTDVYAADPAIVDECAFRLGIMCLLTRVNRDVGRKSFAEKKKVFAVSTLLTINELKQYALWNRETIDDRQQYLAKLAAAAWRFQ